MKPITTPLVTIHQIRESEVSQGTFEAKWDAFSSEGANEAVEAALADNGFELDQCGAISGLFDERGCDASRLQVNHGIVCFRPIRKP